MKTNATRFWLAALMTILVTTFASVGGSDKALASIIPIPISNPSFEVDAVLGPPGYTLSATDWTSGSLNADGVYDQSYFGPSVSPTPTDGHQVAWLTNSLDQVLTTNLAPGTEYTLQADFSEYVPAGGTTSYILALYAGGSLVATAPVLPLSSSGWVTATATYLSPSVVTAGQALEVKITKSGTGLQLLADNVRLDSEAPEPASASVLLTSGVTMLVLRRRRA